MIYSNVDFNVVYVDPGIATAGDGTTPETAINSLPTTEDGFADNTCYIIRRTDDESSVVLPSGDFTNVTNLLIMGMPNTADRLYALMPEAAKIAWGADAYDYANILGTAESLVLPNLKVFLMHRVHLFRDGATADNYILDLDNSSTVQLSAAFENCKFGYKGINIDTEGYSGEISDSLLKQYVSMYYAKLLSLRNCIINHAVTGNSVGEAIVCYYPQLLHVENVQIFSALGRSTSDAVLNLCSGSSAEMLECTVNNIHHTLIFNGTNRYIPPLIRIYADALSARIQYIAINMEGRALSETMPTELYIEDPLIALSDFREYKISDISVYIPYCWNIDSAVFSADSLYVSNNVPGIEKEIRNLTITLGTDETIAIGSPTSYSTASESSKYCVAAKIQCNSGDYEFPAKVPIVDGVVINHPRGRAIYCESVRLTNATIQGTALFSNTVADITDLSTWFPGYALILLDSSQIQVGTLTVNLENETYPYSSDPAISANFSYGSNIFVNSSNVSLMATETLSASEDYLACTCNNEGATGHFIHRCPLGIADTWNVYRTGGAPASIKLTQSTSSSGAMVLGRKPFHGILLTPTSAGRHILKAHVAYKGFQTDELGQNMIVSVSVQNAEGVTETYWSNVHGRWSNDSESVWNNDTGLTQKCLEIPMDLTSTNPLDIRVFYSWKHASGFVYLDPAIELISTAQ